MGKIRDFLVKLGLISSAGATISNAGIRLLNIRNQLMKAGKGSLAAGTNQPLAENAKLGIAKRSRKKRRRRKSAR
jgi:hypothetical protein